MVKKILKSGDLNKDVGNKKSLPPSFGRTGIVSKEEIKAQTKGQKIVAEAERDAERIRNEAEALKTKIETEMEKAKKKGLQEGKEEGLAEFLEQIQKVRELRKEIYTNAEPEVMKLVISIAHKVIGDLVETHKDVIHAIVHQALEHSLGDRITVRIHPTDYKRLKTEDLEFKGILDRTKHIHFREDESIEKGGCIIETEIGTIDAQLETQLKVIR